MRAAGTDNSKALKSKPCHYAGSYRNHNRNALSATLSFYRDEIGALYHRGVY